VTSVYGLDFDPSFIEYAQRNVARENLVCICALLDFRLGRAHRSL
jgi:hypothetical protein